jgi:2-C-methyl-D-erythritol 4-phosphate cytidylyltransferase/2-C-methyl-D-erythritol 2,4-cyclodiphosphate synthase
MVSARLARVAFAKAGAYRTILASHMHVAAIIAAGGRGSRLGADRPKQFLEIGGRSILEMSIAALAASDRIQEIVVALPADHLDATAKALKGSIATPLTFVAGGERRQDSVANAFARTSQAADVILIHDAARPFVTQDVIGRAIDAAHAHGAAVVAIGVRDTVKQAGEAAADGSRLVRGTIPRDTVYLAQTPQAFKREVLSRALSEGANVDATDEAMLVERLGLPVHVVEGDPNNIKITTPEDLATARAVADQTSVHTAMMRIGTGYDLHTLVAGRPLILAGVTIDFDRGLSGHSDADIVCHAVTDAVLGAAALGDIGRLFPDTDQQWKGADSIMMLEGAVAKVRASGYRVVNVDVTVIAQKPKLLPYLDAMRANLAAALDVDAGAVSIKGKTNEGVDSMGHGESMACHAVALISKS